MGHLLIQRHIVVSGGMVASLSLVPSEHVQKECERELLLLSFRLPPWIGHGRVVHVSS